jgi:hypothetical protein
MSLSPFDSFQSRFVTYLLNCPRTLHFTEKEKRAGLVAHASIHKQGNVQRFKFAGRLEFSVGQWVI